LIVLGRVPTKEEMSANLAFLERQHQYHRARLTKDKREATSEPENAKADLAALTDLAHVLLNLNEFVYVR